MSAGIDPTSFLNHPMMNQFTPGMRGLLPAHEDQKPQPPASNRAGGAEEGLGAAPASEVPSWNGDFYARMTMFELEYHSTRAIQSENGETLIERTSLSIQYMHLEASYASGGAAEPVDPNQVVEEQMPLAERLGPFSPQATAQRIFDFAVSRFGSRPGEAGEAGQNDTARQNYTDYILPAIEQGFEEAMGSLSSLSDEILDIPRDTMGRIRDLFQNFVEKGLTQPEIQPAETEFDGAEESTEVLA